LLLGLWFLLGTPPTGPVKAPDVVPGIPNRILRELDAGPLRVRIVQGPERWLIVATAEAAKAGNAVWTSLDAGSEAIQGEPAAMTFSVGPVDRRINDLFMIQLTRSRGAGAKLTSRYVVRLTAGRPQFLCRLPQAGVGMEVSVVALVPSLLINVNSAAEQVRFVLRNDDTCLMSSSGTGGSRSGDLAYSATLAQAEMFRAMGRWEEAGDAFQQALRFRPDSPAAEQIAIWAMRMRSNYFDLQCYPGDNATRRLPITGLLKKLFDSYDDYHSLFPATDVATKVRFRKAAQLETCGHLEEAAALYRQILETRPSDELAPYARELREEAEAAIRKRDRSLAAPRAKVKGRQVAPSSESAQPGVAPDGAPPRR
jgi:hypothetical protein